MIENRIDQNAINHHSYCMTEDNVLHYGLLYKEKPNARTWSLHSELFSEQHNLSLRWACPSLGLITRPELRNIRFDTVENQTSEFINNIEKQSFLERAGFNPKFKG
jgi:sucrose-6-phosphate hydrolase SacC (GH32 family)